MTLYLVTTRKDDMKDDDIGRVAGLVTGHLAEGDEEMARAELAMLSHDDTMRVALRLALRLAIEVDPTCPAARDTDN
jgi:hypothetical protein